MPNDAAILLRPFRPPQDNIPRTRQERDLLLRTVAAYVGRTKPVPPLSLDELRRHAAAVLKIARLSPECLGYAGVLLNNEVWRPTLAAIPYHKRLLLLPKCLRDRNRCPAPFDRVGLLCQHCGSCMINDFKNQAERLGYAVLVAEGSPVVMSLIETGKVEAVVGVSCLAVLERVFPYMEAGAIPGIAVPLLQDGCADTSVDVDWVWDAIYLTSEDRAARLNLEELRSTINDWFTRQALAAVLGPVDDQTTAIALEWMTAHGKRWRPFLTASTYRALSCDHNELPAGVRSAAVAVECFHKASLIHDDIEDRDQMRYGRKSLYAEFGVPIALNVGDFLLGEGYRLLAEAEAPDTVRAKMLAVAAHGHRTLCLGQGTELSWIRQPRVLTVQQVLEIFSRKTSPAFEVALKLGAILAGCRGEGLEEALEQYSRSLGIAYQIRDDIEDFRSNDEPASLNTTRPSLMLAIAHHRAAAPERRFLGRIWSKSRQNQRERARLERILAELGVERLASDLMESYKSRAIGSLQQVTSSRLKALLRRVIARIFNDLELMGCCNDHTAGYAQSRLPGQGPSR